MRPAWIVIVVAFLAAQSAWSQWQLEVVATGGGMVPPNQSLAIANGAFVLNEPTHTLTYIVVVNGTTPTSLSVRLGVEGLNGPLVFPLAGGPVFWQGTTPPLSPSDVITIMKKGMYLRVDSAGIQNGELRGQLEVPKRTYFTSSLSGGQTAATGTGWARVCEADHIWAYDVTTTGIAAPTSASVRLGPPGAHGPVVFELAGAGGHWCGVSPFLTAFDTALCNLGLLSFQVDSAAFQGGEIFGAIVPSASFFSSRLDGAQETPPTPSTAAGKARFGFQPQNGSLSLEFKSDGLSSAATELSIRRGVLGEAGTSVFSITNPSSAWSGTVGLNAVDQDALFRGSLYLEVRTVNHPMGEIRGQIRPDPYVFGGAVSSHGIIKISAWGSTTQAGSSITVSLANALPGTYSVLFLSAGASVSTTFNSLLPMVLPPIGTLYTDASYPLATLMDNGASGCPEMTFPYPSDPALSFTRVYAQWATFEPFNPPYNILLSDAVELTLLP